MLRTLLAVAIGGSLGAVARFLTAECVYFFISASLPYGTLVVNCLGAFFMGLIMTLISEAILLSEHWRFFFVIGFLGAYTTFSSFSWETWVLYQQKLWWPLVLNILANNIGAFAMTLIGISCGRFWANNF